MISQKDAHFFYGRWFFFFANYGIEFRKGSCYNKEDEMKEKRRERRSY